MPPTIGDVARMAGVGIGTVSRVLNRSSSVSDQTRQRVMAAIERLGYRPSPIARAFGRRRTHTLELIVPLFAGALFLDILRGIETALMETRYTLLVRTVDGPVERERTFDECCTQATSDGALLVWLPPTEAFVERVKAAGFLAVLLNAYHPQLWSVGVNHDHAAEQAVRYCYDRGHRRIALVDRPEDPFDATSRGICERGYRQTLAALGLSVPAEYERVAEFSPTGGATAVDSLMTLADPPTAILAASAAQAIGVLEAARSRGWEVPRDLSVVGYSDTELAQFLGLTTVQVPVLDIGREATSFLLSALAEPDIQPRAAYLPTELVVRRTCGPPPA
jgi:DNA-binding LacI/PurR family transcriptional regulator